jgi:heme oxygenase (staphylobilin-producing)
MIAVINRLPVREGMADEVVERFANGRGFVQDFPGFVSMEVLRSEGADEVLVITRWQNQDAFDSWVHSDAFRKAHGRGGGSDLLRGHPQMSAYEVAVVREPGRPGT